MVSQLYQNSNCTTHGTITITMTDHFKWHVSPRYIKTIEQKICEKAYKQFTKQESFWFFYAECICDLTVKCTQLMFVDFTPALLILQVTNTVWCVSLSDAYTQIFFLDLAKIGVLSPMISEYRGLFQYKDVSYQYRDPHVKNETGTTVFIFYMGIPIPGKDSLYIGTGPLHVNSWWPSDTQCTTWP